MFTPKRVSSSLWLAALVVTAVWLASAALPASAQTCKDYGGTFTCPPTPPSTEWGNVCGTAPSYYCSYAPENCAANETFDCQSCSCVCDTGNYPCPGCTVQTSTPGDPCSPPINGVYQNACGNCGCDTGYQLCSSTNTCVAVIACPEGTTFDPCTSTCSSPYILRSPASPQLGDIDIDGFIQATGYFTLGGDFSAGNDIYMNSGKAIRLDDAADTQLNVGNFGGGRGDLAVQGRLGVGHLDPPGYSIDVRSATSLPMINLKDEAAEWTGLRLSRDSAAGAGAENWFIGMNATDDSLRLRGGSSDDWLTVTAAGESRFAGDLLVAPDRHFRMSPGAQPAAASVGDGSMYYDLTDDKFKCYEGGAWKDCVTDGAAVGSGIGPQVAVWEGDGSLGGDPDFTWEDTANRLTVNSDSTTDPPRLLMTATSIDTPNLPGPGIVMTTGAAAGGFMLKMQQGGGDYFAISDDAGNTDYLVANPSGNVGIGDATPTAKLDVAGSIGINDQAVITGTREIQNVAGYTQTAGDFTFSGSGNFSVSSTNPIDLGSTTAVASGNAFILSPGTAPTAAEGGMYYDSAEQKFKCYEGTPGSGGAWVDCTGTGGSVGGTGGVDQVAFWNSASEMTGSADFKWVDSTNRFGLGATNPQFGLDLRSGDSALLSVDDTNGANYAGMRVARSGTERWFVGMDSAGLLQLRRDSTTNDLTIDASGNVGLGDVSPTNKLDVTGSIGVGDTTVITAGRAIENTTGYSQASGNFAVAGAGTFTTSTGAVTLAGNTQVSDGRTFRFGAFAADPAGQPGMMYYNTTDSKFRCFEGAGWKDCGGQTGATFGSGAAGQVAYWAGSDQLTGENAFFYDQATDRLGLGTTAPGFPLDIVQPSGSVSDTAIIRLHQNNATQLWTGLRLDRAGATERWFLGMESADDDLLFRASGSNRMVISQAGNVGIGNDNPVSRLDVLGQVNSTDGYAVGGTNVISSARAIQNVSNYSQGSGNFSMIGGGTATFTTSSFDITSGSFTVSGTTLLNNTTVAPGRYLRLEPGGNPQPTPLAGMMYYDSVNDKFRCAEGSPVAWVDCIVDTGGGSAVTGSGSANQVTYWADSSTLTGSDNLFFTGTRLGITETAPGFPLDLAPTGGDLPIIRLHSPTGSSYLYTGLRLDRDKGVEQWFIGLDDVDDALKFRRSSTNAMIITTGGNVGINVGAPTARLSVGGNANVSGTLTTNALVTNSFKMGSSTDGYVLTYDVATDQGLWKPAPGGNFPPPGTVGSTIYSDGTNWQADATLYNDGSKIVLGPQASTVNVGVGMDSPVAKLQVLNGDVQFSPLAGSDSIYSTGPRMTWYDTQTAFRAGTSSTAWTGTKIGNNSAAFNYNTEASGSYSFSIGYSTTASANAAFSAGWLSEANGNYSTAIGYRSQVSGAGSVGIGYFADTGNSYSVAIGKYVTAGAANSYVFGKGGDLASEDLVNGIQDSIMMGVGYTAPTLFIGESPVSTDTYGRVGIGNTSPAATMDISGTLRLSGSLTNDPVGAVNGTMYYNSSSNTFRCYTAGAWADCMGGGGGGGGTLPSGTLDQALRHNGTTWEATGELLVSSGGQLDFSGGLAGGSGCTVYADGNMACSGTIQSTGGALTGDLLTLNPAAAPATASDGMMYYDNTLNKFQCRENGVWVDCITSLSAAFPAAIAGDTLRFDGSDWVSNDIIYNDGTNVGIGQNSPSSRLHVASASISDPALYSESSQHDAIKGQASADGKTAVVGDAPGLNAYAFFGYAPNGYGGQFEGDSGVYGVADSGHGGHFTSVSGVGLYASSTSGYGAIIENGNVGIGLTNPAYELDVNGQANATELCINGDCRTGWPSGGTTLPTGTAGQTLRSDGVDWVANSVLYNDGTNVGIGETSPSSKLHVTSASTTDPAIYVESTGDDGLKAVATTAGKSAVVGDASGSSAIGVYGISGTGYGGYFTNTTGNANALQVVGHGADSVYASNDGGGTAIRGYVAGTTGTGGAFIGGTGSNGIGVSANASAGNAINATSASGTAANLSSTSGTGLYVSSGGYGAVIASGNVGIGFNALNPDTFKLEVDGSVGPALDDTYDLGSPTRRWRDLYLGPSTIHIGTQADETTLSYASGQLTFNKSLASGNDVKAENDVYAFGDLFVASQELDPTLMAYRDAFDQPILESRADMIEFGVGANATHSNTVAIGYYAAASYQRAVAIGDQAAASSTGAVAIGTSAVSSSTSTIAAGENSQAAGVRSLALGFNSKATQDYGVAIGSGIKGVIASGNQSVAIGNWVEASGSNSIIIGSNNDYEAHGIRLTNNIPDSLMVGFSTTPTLYVDGSNVGIGTTSPGYKLHVNGTLNATQVCINGSCQSSWPSGGGGISGSGTSGYVPKWNGTSSLTNSRIYDNGTYVGIGDSTPSYHLDVSGWVRGTSGLCIGSDCRSSWPSGGGLSGSGATYYVPRWTSSSSLGYSGQIYDAGTYVGIGTTASGYKLNVNGYIRGSGLCIGSDCRTSWPSGGGTETDPQVGSNSTSYVPRWNGSSLSTGSIHDDGAGHIGVGMTSSSWYGMRISGDVWISTGDALCIGGSCRNSWNYLATFTGSDPVAGRVAYWYDSNSRLSYTSIYYSNSNYNVSIGTSPSASYRLYVSGAAYSTGGWIGSDVRWKKDIQELESPLDKALALRGVSYEWRRDEFPDRDFDSGRQLGFIAQEVEGVVPELVKTDDDGYKAISYGNLTALLLEAIKELDGQLGDLNKKLEESLEGVVKLAPDGSLAVPANLVAEDNAWGASSGWILCPEEGDCSCPDGYFVTELKDRGEYVKCNQL